MRWPLRTSRNSLEKKWVVLTKPEMTPIGKNIALSERLLGKLGFCISDQGDYLRVHFHEKNTTYDLPKSLFTSMRRLILNHVVLLIVTLVIVNVALILFGIIKVGENALYGNLGAVVTFLLATLFTDVGSAIFQWLKTRGHQKRK